MRNSRTPTFAAGLLLTMLVAGPDSLRAADGATRIALDLAWAREADAARRYHAYADQADRECSVPWRACSDWPPARNPCTWSGTLGRSLDGAPGSGSRGRRRRGDDGDHPNTRSRSR